MFRPGQPTSPRSKVNNAAENRVRVEAPDARLLLTLIVFLGGAWFVLLNQIRNLTAQLPADRSLLPLAMTHYLMFAYLLLSLTVFYGRGLSYAGDGDPPFLKHVSRLTFRTWPIVLLAILFYWVAVLLIDSKPDSNAITLAVVVPTTLAALFILSLVARNDKRAGREAFVETAVFAGILIGLFIPYMLSLSILLAGVDSHTDREHYVDGDIAITVRPSGYVFAPRLITFECGPVLRKIGASGGTFILPADAVKNTDYFLIRYEPQGWLWTGKHFGRLNVATRFVKGSGWWDDEAASEHMVAR